MTTTLPAPAVEVERVDVRKATALILADSIRLDLPYPYEFRRNGTDSDLLCLSFDRISDVIAWSARFGQDAKAHFNDKTGMDHIDAYVYGWHGWCLGMSAREDRGHGLAPIDAETAALIDEVTAEPGICPSCGSPAPGLHPSTAPEGGEVLALCPDPFHHATCADPIVAIAEGREINLITVGGHFRETWAKLPALRRAELVEACQVAGWCGDWDAAYRHVMGNVPGRALRGDMSPAPAEAADDARQIVSELDDLERVNVKQLAAVVDIDPDAEIAYEVAHRHDGPQYVDVLTVDPDLPDEGRGGAGVARIGEPIDLTQDVMS